MLQAEFGVIDGAAEVEDFALVIMRCGNLLLDAAPDVVDVFSIGRVGETDGRDEEFLICGEAANRFLEAHDTTCAEGAQIDDAVIVSNALHVFEEYGLEPRDFGEAFGIAFCRAITAPVDDDRVHLKKSLTRCINSSLFAQMYAISITLSSFLQKKKLDTSNPWIFSIIIRFV